MKDDFLKYLEQEKRLSKHTIIAYANDLSQLGHFLATHFEINDLASVEGFHLRSWIIHLSENGLNNKSINRKIATSKSFYKYLNFRGVIPANPTTILKPLKVDKKLPEFVNEVDITKLLDQVGFSFDFEGLRDKLILELLYATGIRLSELLNIKESDINLYDASVKVLGKRNKERIIPLGNPLLQLINQYSTFKSQLVFQSDFLLVTDKGEKMYPMFIYRKVKSYLSIVTTISKRSPHVIRHSFATHLLDKGADLNAVKDLLGHSSLAATQVYTHNSIEKLKAAFDQAHPKA